MANLTAAYAPSRWRVIAKTDANAPLTPASYAIARQDGGPGAPTVSAAFLPNPADLTTVALVLSSAILDGVILVVTLGSGSVAVSFQAPTQTPAMISPTDDPEMEAFGLDFDWIDGDLDATGDCPRRRGLDCLMHDLPLRGKLRPRELVQWPDAGAALDDEVNASADPQALTESAARLETECRQDPRVEQAHVETTFDNAGGNAMQMLIKPFAFDAFIDLDNANG